MLRAITLVCTIFVTANAFAQAADVQGSLKDVREDARGHVVCGKYFSAGREITGAILFRVSVTWVPNLTIMTQSSRVAVTIDDTKSIPEASVELRTGMYHTALRISKADWEEARRCLPGARLS